MQVKTRSEGKIKKYFKENGGILAGSVVFFSGIVVYLVAKYLETNPTP